MHKGTKPVKLGLMDKKIPSNAKYSGVTSKINSGNAASKIRLISNKEFLKRRDELFRRIEPKWLCDLFDEYEHSGEKPCSSTPMIAKVVQNQRGENEIHRLPIEEMNQGPRIVSYQADEDVPSEQPYLVLDVRTSDRFEVNRIFKAKSFPASYLNRDKLTPELIKMKNKEGCLIIVYGETDQSEMDAANSFVQRGFDNIYLLSGGIVDFSAKYPHYIEGILPETPESPMSNTQVRKASRGSTAMTLASREKTPLSARSTSSPRSCMKGIKSKMMENSDVISLADSMGSNLSIAESIISRAALRKSKI